MFATIEVNLKFFCIENYLTTIKDMTMIFDIVNPNPRFPIEHISIIYSNTKFDNTSIKKNWSNGEPYNHIATKKENISITFSDLSQL